MRQGQGYQGLLIHKRYKKCIGHKYSKKYFKLYLCCIAGITQQKYSSFVNTIEVVSDNN